MTTRTDLLAVGGAEPGEPGDDIELLRYVNVLRKRKWIMLAVVAVGMTLAVIYTMRQTRIYQATASVVVDPAPPQVFGSQVQEVIQLGSDNYWANQEYYNTQIDIIQSYPLARRTVTQNGLYARLVPPAEADGLSEKEHIDTAGWRLTESLSAAQRGDSRIVDINVKHPDGQLAADLANEHVQTYLGYTLDLRSTGSGEVSQFLSSELDTAEQRLRESERKLHEFKKSNSIISASLEDEQSVLAANIARYTAAQSDARIKRIELEALRKRALALEGDDVLESPIFALASNSGTVEILKQQYLQEKQRLIERTEELGPRHPNFIKQQKKVDDLYGAIQAEARRALRELDERYQAALETEQRFGAELAKYEQQALDLEPKTAEYNELARQQKSNEENYNLVLGRLRTTELSGRNEQINIREHTQADDAYLVHPRLRLNLAMAGMLSLMLGIGLAFLLEYIDRSIKTAEDVEGAAGVPLLGIIPVLSEVPRDDSVETLQTRDLYVFNNPKSQAAECCRSIRTNLLFSGADRPLQVLTVSSANPREGKTTSVIYLGTTMAQSGQRVLIIDTDMRRPRLHRSMGVPRGIGVSNLLLGDADYDDAIKTTDIPNLFVLPCGPTPPNPAELLLSNRFSKVIQELRTRFDRILLDSPPLQAVTDAAVLARLSDGAIMVVQAGKTSRDDLTRCSRQLSAVNAHIVGVVLNDLDVSDQQYGYKYYAYGYGDDTSNRPDAESQA